MELSQNGLFSILLALKLYITKKIVGDCWLPKLVQTGLDSEPQSIMFSPDVDVVQIWCRSKDKGVLILAESG